MFLLTFFFFNDTATTEIYTLSLHDALPIYDTVSRLGGDEFAIVQVGAEQPRGAKQLAQRLIDEMPEPFFVQGRSEEHTSELQSRQYLVCRLLLEKKKNNSPSHPSSSFHTLL